MAKRGDESGAALNGIDRVLCPLDRAETKQQAVVGERPKRTMGAGRRQRQLHDRHPCTRRCARGGDGIGGVGAAQHGEDALVRQGRKHLGHRVPPGCSQRVLS
jgi:hypothetical protein